MSARTDSLTPENSRGIPCLERVVSWLGMRHSLQFRVSLFAVLLLLSVVAGGTALSLRATGAAMFENELHRTRDWAAALALSKAQEMAMADPVRRDLLVYHVQTLIQTRTVAYVAFVDTTGKVIAAAESEPGLLKWALPPDGRRMQLDLLQTSRLVRPADRELTCIDIVMPVFPVRAGETANVPQPIIGYLRLATDVSATKARFTQIANRLLRIDVGILLLVIPCTLLVTRQIVSPLNELAHAARLFADGAMEARAPVRSQNEIGQLARSFNRMAQRVAQSQKQLLDLTTELEARVEDRTHELAELAAKDPLTALYNRRSFGEVIRRQFAVSQRYHLDLTCLMFDLDRFKQINDQFGHGTGDEVLITFAQAITSQLRDSDVAARFGGDEFILLLPQTSASAATTLADRIMSEFATQSRHRLPGVPASVSTGLASLENTESPSAEALIKEADLALLAAKAGGRNRVVEAPRLVSSFSPAVPDVT